MFKVKLSWKVLRFNDTQTVKVLQFYWIVNRTTNFEVEVKDWEYV